MSLASTVNVYSLSKVVSLKSKVKLLLSNVIIPGSVCVPNWRTLPTISPSRFNVSPGGNAPKVLT